MAFWRLGFNSGPTVDSLLAQSSSQSGYHTPSSPLTTLDKLLDLDDLLQEIKAQNHKLAEFLGQRDVVRKLLSYVSGSAFDDEDEEHAESPGPGGGVDGFGFGEVMDTGGRTPEDRAKAELRRVRYPYLCTEILASTIWTIEATIFSHSADLLGPFWDGVLDQSPERTHAKAVQLGYWSRANSILFTQRPADMLAFVKSRPNLVERLLTHLETSPMVDILFRILQCEGAIDWLAGESLIPRLVNLLSPRHSPELHNTVADFLKNVIMFCSSPHSVPTGNGLSGGEAPPVVPGMVPPPTPAKQEDTKPRFITTRLLRELASEGVVALMMDSALDEVPLSSTEGDTASDSWNEGGRKLSAGVTDVETPPKAVSVTSSLINSMSIIIDLIRRNNSDFVEQQILQHHKRLAREAEERELMGNAEPPDPNDRGPSVVSLGPLLSVVSSRLGSLQALLCRPRSLAGPLLTTVGIVEPLTVERFRICELYAELMHCSNMALLNRPEGLGPAYDEEGFLTDASQVEVLAMALSPDGAEELDWAHMAGTMAREEFTMVSTAEGKIGSLPDSSGRHSPTPIPSEETSLDSKSGVLARAQAARLRDIVQGGAQNTLDEKTSAIAPSVIQGQAPPCKPPDSPSLVPLEPSHIYTLEHHAADMDGADGSPRWVPPGEQLKRAFGDHKVLETCVDLFFAFPWHNFLHNVVYDLLQQVLNGRMDHAGNLALARSLFEKAKIAERILEGNALNEKISARSGGMRLGYMGHMILIAEEVSKALAHYPLVSDASSTASSIPQPAWDEFVVTAVRSAREQTSIPLGGGVPLVPHDTASTSGSSGMSDDDDDPGSGSFWTPGGGRHATRTRRGSGGSEMAERLRREGSIANAPPISGEDGAAGEFARYFVSQLNSASGDRFSNSSDESDDDEGPAWSNRSGASAARHGLGISGDSFIFDFENRFGEQDFTRRRASGEQLDGFGDDFGPFSDAGAANDPFGDDHFAPPSSSTGAPPKRPKPPPPAVPPRKNLTTADWNAEFRANFASGKDMEANFRKMDLGDDIEDEQEDDGQFGEFAAGEGAAADDDFGEFAGAAASGSNSAPSDPWVVKEATSPLGPAPPDRVAPSSLSPSSSSPSSASYIST